MPSLLLLLCALIGVGSLAFFANPLWLYAVLFAVLIPIAYSNSILSLTLLFTLLMLICAALSLPRVRRFIFSDPVLRVYRRLLPTISQTEREALQAGHVWWDAELFSGQPHWEKLHRLPAANLNKAEQAFLDNETEQLCQQLNDWHIRHEQKDLPEHIWQFIRQQGFLGLIIPKQYGGKGFSAFAHSQIVMKISSRSVSAAVSVMVPNSLGPAELLLTYGTTEQKQYYLPRLAAGKEIPCFALTSPHAGSDAAAIPDRGIVCYQHVEGEKVLGMRVTWDKRYITLAPIATLLGLAFHLYDPDQLLGKKTDIGITLALIPTDHEGVKIGRRHYPAHQAFLNGPTSGEDVFIPLEWVIGGQSYVGKGWQMLMNCLAAGRSISLPATGTGAAKFLARNTSMYARIRHQFKVPLSYLEGIEEPLARIVAEAYTLDAARHVTCSALDAGYAPVVVSAILKYHATERMRDVTQDAMDIHAGRAICEGESNYLFGIYQAVPVAITVEGANILTRSLIIFGQGALRCHPWLLREMRAAQAADTPPARRSFDRALSGHIRFFKQNMVRALWHNLTRGRFISLPKLSAIQDNAAIYRQINRHSINFIVLADTALLLLGGKLKFKEKLSGRFADILSELYLLSCVMKHHADTGDNSERYVIKWITANSFHRIEQSLIDILHNFPNRWLGKALSWLIFPWGQQHCVPSDYTGRKVAQLLTTENAFRDRLSQGIYINKDPNDITGRLEHAFQALLTTAPLEKRLQRAVKTGELNPVTGYHLYQAALDKGLINAVEHQQLKTAKAALDFAIKVDDFAADYFKTASTQQTEKAKPVCKQEIKE